METPFNKLTPAEAERLAWLAEEAAEVVQAAMKILRHGYEDYNPMDPEGKPYRSHLEKEIGQLTLTIALMGERGDIDIDNVESHSKEKAKGADTWLHYNKGIAGLIG